MDFNQAFELIRIFLRRAVRSNFQREKATDRERETLAANGIGDPLAQDYAAWRRAILALCAASMAVLVVIEVFSSDSMEELMVAGQIKAAEALKKSGLTQEEQRRVRLQVEANQIKVLGRDNLETIDGLMWVIRLALIVAAVLVFLAARSWATPRQSRRWARGAFYVLFLTPFALAIIPISAMLDFGHVPAAQQKQLGMMLGATWGFTLFRLIGPRAFALLPAAMRAAMTLKTLVPESPMPGWVTALVAPLVPLFLVVIVATINQMGGNFMLMTGLICLMIGPMIYLFQAREVVRPHRPEEVEELVAGVRNKSAIFNLVGIVFVAIFILDANWFSFADALKFLVTFLGTLLLLLVVGSDAFLALLHAGHRQTMEFGSTELAQDLDRKFAGLASVGLTEIRAAKVEEAPPPAK